MREATEAGVPAAACDGADGSEGMGSEQKERSLDQLPAMPADSAGGAIIRDLGDYRLEKQVLGEGAFGKVRLATSCRTSHQVAVKVIKRKKLNERAEVLLQREVKHHEKLRHENIVRLHTFIMTPTKYYLVMEFCDGASRPARTSHRPGSAPIGCNRVLPTGCRRMRAASVHRAGSPARRSLRRCPLAS